MNASRKEQLNEDLRFYDDQIERILSFWQTHGHDREHGGFFTYLDEAGSRFSDVKPVWAQGRAMAVFARAYREIEPRKDWLDLAEQTFDFLRDHGFDDNRKMYFSLLADGTPVRKRRYWFSDAFMALGSAELYRVTGNERYLSQMLESYNRVTAFYFGRETVPSKFEPAAETKGLADAIILLNLIQHVAPLDGDHADIYASDRKHVLASVIDHVEDSHHVFLENVAPDGSKIAGPKGRLVNPGHSLEGAWFLLDEAAITGDGRWSDLALDIIRGAFDLGWDGEHGGLMYFADIAGKPLEQLEWDMKLWWPHTEALIALLKAYRLTGDDRWYDRYRDVLTFVRDHFVTEKEWWGYLHHDNTVSHRLKGNLFKGPFHIPRMLLINRKIVASMTGEE